VSNLETLVREQKNAQLVSDLKEGSHLLHHIDDAFRNSFIYKDSVVISFFETKDSRTVNVHTPSPFHNTERKEGQNDSRSMTIWSPARIMLIMDIPYLKYVRAQY
jgi:hypothetical protein